MILTRTRDSMSFRSQAAAWQEIVSEASLGFDFESGKAPKKEITWRRYFAPRCSSCWRRRATFGFSYEFDG